VTRSYLGVMALIILDYRSEMAVVIVGWRASRGRDRWAGRRRVGENQHSQNTLLYHKTRPKPCVHNPRIGAFHHFIEVSPFQYLSQQEANTIVINSYAITLFHFNLLSWPHYISHKSLIHVHSTAILLGIPVLFVHFNNLLDNSFVFIWFFIRLFLTHYEHITTLHDLLQLYMTIVRPLRPFLTQLDSCTQVARQRIVKDTFESIYSSAIAPSCSSSLSDSSDYLRRLPPLIPNFEGHSEVTRTRPAQNPDPWHGFLPTRGYMTKIRFFAIFYVSQEIQGKYILFQLDMTFINTFNHHNCRYYLYLKHM
jgi:hypothetical protein